MRTVRSAIACALLCVCGCKLSKHENDANMNAHRYQNQGRLHSGAAATTTTMSKMPGRKCASRCVRVCTCSGMSVPRRMAQKFAFDLRARSAQVLGSASAVVGVGTQHNALKYIAFYTLRKHTGCRAAFWAQLSFRRFHLLRVQMARTRHRRRASHHRCNKAFGAFTCATKRDSFQLLFVAFRVALGACRVECVCSGNSTTTLARHRQ